MHTYNDEWVLDEYQPRTKRQTFDVRRLPHMKAECSVRARGIEILVAVWMSICQRMSRQTFDVCGHSQMRADGSVGACDV